MKNLDIHRRHSTQNTSNGDEMLPKTPQHIVYRASQMRRYATVSSMYLAHTKTVYNCKKIILNGMAMSQGLLVSQTILNGTVNCGRRGGQRKRWEDNIREWTCLSVYESLKESKDQKRWREMISRSVMAPYGHQRSWDRYRYWPSSGSRRCECDDRAHTRVAYSSVEEHRAR